MNNVSNFFENQGYKPKELGVDYTSKISNDSDHLTQIEELISTQNIVVFIKGTPKFPQCSQSANTIAILDILKVPYTTINILDNTKLFKALKKYSNWPTIPQVYVQKELLGGNDIITKLFQQNKLLDILQTTFSKANSDQLN